jgi:dTMP kinase
MTTNPTNLQRVRGFFITLEGGEGAGKTTQAALLAERLRAAGYRVHVTREPGGTPLGQGVRALLLHPAESLRALAAAGLAASSAPDEPAPSVLPLTEALLLAADRAQHVAEMREPLAAGVVVISDRYADATRAYQGAARGLDTDTIETLQRIATGGLTPDLTLLFDLPVAEGQRRKQHAHKAGGEWNRLDSEAVAFHERVRESYLTLAAAEPSRWVVLDATLPPDALAERVWAVAEPRLPREG